VILTRVERIDVKGVYHYVVVDEDGRLVVPVAKFLRYLYQIGRSPNTLKSYSYHLKSYFEFLQQKDKQFDSVGLDDLAEFVGWLRNPARSLKVVPLGCQTAARREVTVNTMLTCVTAFYDYLWQHGEYEGKLPEKLRRMVSVSHRSFKSFLHHISEGKPIAKHILKLRIPRRPVRTLAKESVDSLMAACRNNRDYLLLWVLYEGGLRIGEALGLWLEDIDLVNCCLWVRARDSLANGARAKTGDRKIYISQELINCFQEYICRVHTDDVKTNHVFVKLQGLQRGQPMAYQDVADLFRRLRKKTGSNATPHMLRHTCATELHRHGWDACLIRQRLGHAHVQTTIQMYIHPGDEDLRQAWNEFQKQKDLKGVQR